jgi:hypothetical protein
MHSVQATYTTATKHALAHRNTAKKIHFPFLYISQFQNSMTHCFVQGFQGAAYFAGIVQEYADIAVPFEKPE